MQKSGEPMLTVDLEDAEEATTEWSIKMLNVLAEQLGVGNDFYFPLLGVVKHLELEAAAATAMSEPTEQQCRCGTPFAPRRNHRGGQWKRALDCAARQFENYYRADMLADPAQRRVALDDALQHAVGILSLAAAPRQADGWQPISSAPKDGTEIWLGREGRLILGYWSGKRGWMREGLQGEDERVMWEATHWQPHTVPEPPETGGKS